MSQSSIKRKWTQHNQKKRKRWITFNLLSVIYLKISFHKEDNTERNCIAYQLKHVGYPLAIIKIPEEEHAGTMEWYVLALIFGMISSVRTDCSSHCLNCAQQIPNAEISINSLTCTLECEGTLTSVTELDKCEKALELFSASQAGFNGRNKQVPGTYKTGDGQDTSIEVAKRYGGFIKRIEKNKKINSPLRENTSLKGMFAKKYGNSLRKFWERDVSELSQDAFRGDSSPENEVGITDDEAINEVKRYGGFLRKFGPKRSNSEEESEPSELQKRYGGFLRRIRPKLRWDNQKRYGGFLRRHFKLSLRSEEDPSSYESFDS